MRLRIKEVAEKQGFNASQLSRRADLSQPTVYRLWHNPYQIVSTDTLTKLAKALKVRVTDLIDEQGDNE